MGTQKNANASWAWNENGNAWYRPRLLGFIQSAFYASIVNTFNFKKLVKCTHVYL